MRVAVVGASAMGCLYGGHLAEAGVEVSLVDVWREHVDAINEKGLHIKGVSGDRVVHVPATTNPETVGRSTWCSCSSSPTTPPRR